MKKYILTTIWLNGSLQLQMQEVEIVAERHITNYDVKTKNNTIYENLTDEDVLSKEEAEEKIRNWMDPLQNPYGL